MLEKHKSPRKTGRSHDHTYSAITAPYMSSRERSGNWSSTISTSALNRKSQINSSPRKRVQFWDQQSVSESSSFENPESCTARADEISPYHDQTESCVSGKDLIRVSEGTTSGRSQEDISRDVLSLSSGYLDWLWSEDIEKRNFSAGTDGYQAHCSFRSRVANSIGYPGECSTVPALTYLEDEAPYDKKNMRFRNSWKGAHAESSKPTLATLAAFVGTDSPRCSSMSMTDLVETVSPKKGTRSMAYGKASPILASHVEYTQNALSHCKSHSELWKENDIDSVLSVPPLHSSSPNSFSASKRASAPLKLEPKRVSISEPALDGPAHGLLHCTLKDGLPKYTFLLDEYDDVLTAKIWMEDMVLGKEQASWRYSFYSLRGEGKRKGRSGWKYWKKKEKLASNLVGKMKVSSILCSETEVDGEKNWSVESEFVLFSARAPELASTACAESPSQACSSSELGLQACSRSSYPLSSTSSSTPQSVTSSSDGCSSVSSPGTISAWYVSQSLIPSSLAAPDVTVQKSRPKSRKWSLHSGITGIRLSKSRTKVEQFCTSESTAVTAKDVSGQLMEAQNQCHSELAAMVISVPFEVQDKLVPSDLESQKDKCYLTEVPSSQADVIQEFKNGNMQKPCCYTHRSQTNQKQLRQANINVILPSGNHGKPFTDSNGPSPLIKRWKDGGKCDCKGWDLGCGLMVLSNQRQLSPDRNSEAVHLRETLGQGKPLMLYKQDSEQEDSYLSLAPQENGLIALDFRAPLSPLQALAIAVAILHGRESGMPDADPSQVVPVAGVTADYDQDCLKFEHLVDLSTVGVPSMREVEEKMANGLVQLPTYSTQDMSQLHDNLVSTPGKLQGSEVLNYAAGLALSFERV